ncbi:hypothetical protein C8F04DRAFT_1344953 [Mycena alexandri]|uniref:Uncharacterized protein n=1 Tax=Mycena alexandri TaxID=1745969 RepID=A0AAD6SZP8_9AGAR|nr:hypothetical protein C8F04DRAFT_1344953 [Mycena alexandri]
MAKMPPRLQLNLALITLIFALPVWHALAHEQSYGEGIEWTWLVMNLISWATKEMSGGARADAMENKLDHHNFEKNINQGKFFVERQKIVTNWSFVVAVFQSVDATVRSGRRKEWQQKIDEWQANRSKPNLYEMEGEGNGDTEATIRQTLRKDKADEAAFRGIKLHGSSVTSFLVTGLQLEESQQRIRREAWGRMLLAVDHLERVQEMHIAFFTKLAAFCRLQAVHMLAAVKKLQEDEDARDVELPPPKAEHVKLYLPSRLTCAQQENGCCKGLSEMEDSLCQGQCADALKQLHSRLHIKRHLLLFREGGGAAGQRACKALIALRGASACGDHRELKASDIELDEEHEVDVTARRKLGSIGSKSRRAAVSSRKKTFSWIWTAGGGPGEDEQQLHESVRVEWSKAKARKERWEEEVDLLHEKMNGARDEDNGGVTAFGCPATGVRRTPGKGTSRNRAPIQDRMGHFSGDSSEDGLLLQEGMAAFAQMTDEAPTAAEAAS